MRIIAAMGPISNVINSLFVSEFNAHTNGNHCLIYLLIQFFLFFLLFFFSFFLSKELKMPPHAEHKNMLIIMAIKKTNCRKFISNKFLFNGKCKNTNYQHRSLRNPKSNVFLFFPSFWNCF